MAVTRSTSVDRTQNARPRVGTLDRAMERVFLLAAAVLVLAAISLTATAKIARLGSQHDSLNLSTLERREQLYPFLQWASTPAERQYISGKIFDHIRSGEGTVSHVGELSQIRVSIQEVLRTRGLTA